ncbi:MAG: bifunctional nuclease family protein [Deltaproteobacteria bacterium]|nr:bifunctional nuclease family protein [Deltaproteobacteria bacterium]
MAEEKVKKNFKELVEMSVSGLTIDPFTSMPIVILKDKDQKYSLPIWIGLIEASAIATELEKIKLSRPMTHDLIKNMLEQVSITVDRVVVDELSDNTFYAKVFLKQNGKEWMLDSRPSDAIALSLRTKASIFVEKEVINKSKKIDLSKEPQQKQSWTDILDNLSPEDFGKYKM